MSFATFRRLERSEIQPLEFRIGHYLFGMEEILKRFRRPFTVKYRTDTAHKKLYINSGPEARSKLPGSVSILNHRNRIHLDKKLFPKKLLNNDQRARRWTLAIDVAVPHVADARLKKRILGSCTVLLSSF